MRIISAGVKSIKREDYDSPLKFIEKIGRTCYKSEDRITDDSASAFIKGLIKSKHLSVIEHYWCHIIIGKENPFDTISKEFLEDFNSERLNWGYPCLNHFEISGWTDKGDGIDGLFVSAPLRCFVELAMLSAHTQILAHRSFRLLLHTVKERIPEAFEGYPTNGLLSKNTDDFNHGLYEFIYSEEEFKKRITRMGWAERYRDDVLRRHMTHTAIFTCDRGVSHELVRMREQCSFAQESTRYCNYSKERFGGEITVIKPFFFKEGTDSYSEWVHSCVESEKSYFELLEFGVPAQEARTVLPNSLKTDLIMTTNEMEWQHIIDLRSKGVTGKPHPQMYEVMRMWHDEIELLSDWRVM